MRKNRYWLYVAILTLLTAIIWVTVTTLGNRQKTTITPDITKAMTPLDTNIDKEVLTKLQLRNK